MHQQLVREGKISNQKKDLSTIGQEKDKVVSKTIIHEKNELGKEIIIAG